MVAYLVLLIALAGLLLWLMAANAKVQKVGEYMFFCGLLAFCFALAEKTIALLR